MRRLVMLTILTLLAMPTVGRAVDGPRTFPETGQTVAGTILQFWNANGGLPVFGLPVSDQRTEPTLTAEGPRSFTVQHFERERLELHPEIAAPYDVLLGRLGDDLLRRQGRDWRNEPNADNPLGGSCQRFADTDRDVCGPFLQYWQSHGLADPRLDAYQRSLALFGLPLTAVRLERNSSGDQVLTQWFERARFEWHPQNPEPYRVLLGRLGAEAYDPESPNGEAPSYHSVTIEPGHTLRVPTGFTIELVATGLKRPRFMSQDATGSIYVAEQDSGRVLAFLIGPHHQIVWSNPWVVAEGLQIPHSVAIDGDTIWITTENQLLRGSLSQRKYGQTLPLSKIADFPSGSRDLYGHRTRTVVLGPDRKLYVSIGSSCDVCEETDPLRATVTRYDLDGSNPTVIARGLRNSVGIAFRDGVLWGVDNGRNGLGDGQPPEELNRIVAGGDYGWPYCSGDRIPSPEFNNAARCNGTITPEWSFTPHTAPLGLQFYDGLGFPPAYAGDALVARHGTARDQVSALSGYDIVRVRFRDGRPIGEQILVSGWQNGNDVWGRPAGLLVDRDGSVLISDDASGRLYRLSYVGSGG